MKTATRARRLTNRYPLLAAAPELERPAIARKGMMHPVVIIILALCAVVLLPYLLFAFHFLGVEGEPLLALKLAKIALVAVIPAMIMTFCLSRWVVPVYIRKVLQQRGYLPPKNTTPQ